MSLYTAYRRAKFWLWANTRRDIPIRRLIDWPEQLHALNLQARESTAVRHAGGTPRDEKGRFAAL